MLLNLKLVDDERGDEFLEELSAKHFPPSAVDENDACWHPATKELIKDIVDQMFNDEFIVISFSLEKNAPVEGV